MTTPKKECKFSNVGEFWDYYMNNAIPADVSVHAVEIIQKAFYAGASAMFALVTDVEGVDTLEKYESMMQALNDEMNAFTLALSYIGKLEDSGIDCGRMN